MYNVKAFFLIYKVVQSNLCITTTRKTKFVQSLQTGGRYEEDLLITVKTVNSDIWYLYKGSIIFHFTTHDTKNNKSACILVQNKNNFVIKQHVINNFKNKISRELIVISWASTLCSGRYMKVIKSLRYHLSGRWLRCIGGRYIGRGLT